MSLNLWTDQLAVGKLPVMSKQNPYQPPSQSGDASLEERKEPSGWLRASCYLCVGLSLLAIAGFCFTAWMLISQAAGLEAEALNYPAEFQNQDDKVIRSSQGLGYASILLALTTLVGGILALKNRWLAGWALLVLSVGVFVALAIVLKPT